MRRRQNPFQLGTQTMTKTSKESATYKACKAQVKRATRELRKARKGGKRVVWELTV